MKNIYKFELIEEMATTLSKVVSAEFEDCKTIAESVFDCLDRNQHLVMSTWRDEKIKELEAEIRHLRSQEIIKIDPEIEDVVGRWK